MSYENKTIKLPDDVSIDGLMEDHFKAEAFNAACERYRAMMKANEGKPYKERLDAINRFRSGL